MNCPDCSTDIGAAYKCRCGWRKGVAPAATVKLLCDACGTESARLLIEGKNLCLFCYSSLPILPRNPAAYQDNPHITEVLKAFANSKYMRRVQEVGPEKAKEELMREPGSDDEERRAA